MRRMNINFIYIMYKDYRKEENFLNYLIIMVSNKINFNRINYLK